MHQRLLSWLCLAVAVLSGVAPVQGFVVCLEPDGCVSVELASVADECAGCGSHDAELGGPAPSQRGSAARDAGELGCPCVDLPVPGTAQDRRVQSRALEPGPGPWLPAPPLPQLLRPASIASDRAARCLEVPRECGVLVQLRSVVLLV